MSSCFIHVLYSDVSGIQLRTLLTTLYGDLFYMSFKRYFLLLECLLEWLFRYPSNPTAHNPRPFSRQITYTSPSWALSIQLHLLSNLMSSFLNFD